MPGDVECPMDWDYLNSKFMESAALAAVPASKENLTKARDMIRNLDTLSDLVRA